VIRTNGFEAIRVSKVAREAGVDRKRVYRYFGNINNLTEAYISENDYWMLFADQLKRLSRDVNEKDSKAFRTKIMKELFRFFIEEPEMQRIILMELSGATPVRSIPNLRETISQESLGRTDDHFKSSAVNFRAVSALLVGGIHYIVLHTRKNGHHFADLNLKNDEGMEALMSTVDQIIDWAFKAAI
jgi:AcrR family transcriptional regulator